MGYSTYFTGLFEFDEPLTEEQINTINKFGSERHESTAGKQYPGIWCDWEVSEDGKYLMHNENEKFYYYVEWLDYLIDKYFKGWGRKLNGVVTWDGEDCTDNGTITITDNIVEAENTSEKLAHLEQGLDKVLSLVPDQLPLLMGINGTVDAKVKKLLSEGAAPSKVKDVVALH